MNLIILLISDSVCSSILCPPLKPRSNPPNSVHDLRIDDFKVISAIGDSITAGFGIDGFKDPTHKLQLSTFYENRGKSWFMGGDENATTVANFVSKYNPDLVGKSTGTHLANICYGKICLPLQYRKSDHFNVARMGALADNLQGEIWHLKKLLKASPVVDYQNDYKLLSIFIGSNDNCLSCLFGKSWLSSKRFAKKIRRVLSFIKSNFPKTVVVISQQFKVSPVYEKTKNIPYCKKLRDRGLIVECPCGFNPLASGNYTRHIMDALIDEYNLKLVEIVQSYNDPKDTNFKVILNPYFRELDILNNPVEFISEIDCFHPGLKAHEVLAIGTWNNLFLSDVNKFV